LSAGCAVIARRRRIGFGIICEIVSLKVRNFVSGPRLVSTWPISCVCAKLIVELDGGHHSEQVEKDAARTAALEVAGYRVIRFWNNDVLSNTSGVLETIRYELLNALGKH
jgi:hypothetical protein